MIGVWPEFFDLRACVCKVGCRGGMLEDWVQHLDFLIARLDYIHFYRDNIYFFVIFSSFVWWGEAKGDKTENNIICFIVVDPQ